MRARFQQAFLYGLILLFLSGAAPQSANPAGGDCLSLEERILIAARSMIGRPYKYQGETPAGFDCSGLVRFSYLAIGMDVPHGTSGLKEATHHVEYCNMRKGDLVFFDRGEKKFGHVGIYLGDDLFVHAPSLGKAVRIDSLQDPYWKEHFCDARRF
jgi:murein DD-endopeptidase